MTADKEVTTDDGLYEWYLDGYDFLCGRWNRLLAEGLDIGEMYRVLERNGQMRKAAWDRKVGNPKIVRGEHHV